MIFTENHQLFALYSFVKRCKQEKWGEQTKTINDDNKAKIFTFNKMIGVIRRDKKNLQTISTTEKCTQTAEAVQLLHSIINIHWRSFYVRKCRHWPQQRRQTTALHVPGHTRIARVHVYTIELVKAPIYQMTLIS